MNVFLVDDDMLIREDIKAFYQWENEGFTVVGEASNGNDAISWLEKGCADIVITDIAMPNGDGIALIRWLKSRQFDGEIIVMSNYDDFDYVKEAMKLGAFDYCLKYKLSPELLLSLLKKASDSIAKKRAKASYSGMTQAQLLRECIKGTYSSKEQERFVQANILSNAYFVQYTRLLDQTQTSYPLIKNISLVQKDCIVLQLKDSDAVVLFPAVPEDTRQATMQQVAIEISKKITEKAVVIYEEQSVQIPLLESKINEMRQSALLYFYSQASVICNQPEISFEKSIPSSSKRNFEHALIGRAEALDRTGFQNLTEEVIAFFEKGKMHPRVVNTFFQNLMFSISQKMEVPDLAQTVSFDENSSIALLRSELERWCDYYFLLQVNSNRSEIIRAIHYIHTNYMRDISLEAISQEAYMSKNHFCTLFRKETGDNFIVYLQKVRIEKAKMYLRNPKYRIQEVAEKVGIDNYRYFSTLFHKYTGMSPSQFRESLQ